jgi:hypothetical protein
MLTPVPAQAGCEGDLEYEDADIRRHATEIHELGPRNHGNSGLLAVHVRDEFFVSFVLFRFGSCETANTNIRWSRVMDGEGPGDGLRELRHTNWGDAGYIFYAPMKLIAEAMGVLGKYFDD